MILKAQVIRNIRLSFYGNSLAMLNIKVTVKRESVFCGLFYS